MAVRSTMLTSLIPRVRLLINDTLPAGSGQVFADQDIQDVLDESRVDVFNMLLRGELTYSGGTPQYLDYETDLGGWEDGYVLKQAWTIVVTPSVSEPIAGHWAFAANTYPPVFITGHLFDVYRAAADLLERYAARYMTRFDFSSDGQSFNVSQAPAMMQKLATTYRMKQRPGVISMRRSDLSVGGQAGPSIAPTALDYMASG